jgi:hypothetical protein
LENFEFSRIDGTLFTACKWLFKLKYTPQIKIMKGTNHFLTENGGLFVCFCQLCWNFFFALTMAREKKVSTLLPLYWNVKLEKKILTPGSVAVKIHRYVKVCM